MASIVKRKKKYSVVYLFEDEKTGEKKQKWETFGTYKEAQKRKAEVEYQQNTLTFKAPTSLTIRDLLYDFMLLYGVNKWAMSTYSSNKSLIDNYINPAIGDLAVQKVTARTIEEFYNKLKTTSAVMRHNHKHNNLVTAGTIHDIHKVLRGAFNQAVKWKIISKNPVVNASKPKPEYKKREIWTASNIKKAIEVCDDTKLALCLHLAFACSMRLGEITGLQWSSVDIGDTAIASDDAYILVKQELTRVSRDAMEVLDNKDILFIFPALRPGGSTRLVLKTPKTESSVRKIWIPKTLALILRKWKEEQAELKEAMQEDFYDFGLVITQSNGRPVESRLIDDALRKLEDREGLPIVVFHSLRHSSTTYKLKLNKGDMKATQGDTGHATMEMITDVYAHILDEDRKSNAQRFDEAFYAGAMFDEKTNTGADAKHNTPADAAKLIELLKSNPALAEQIQQALAQS